MRDDIVGQHQHRRLARLRKLARHAVHEVRPHPVEIVQILLDRLCRDVGPALAQLLAPDRLAGVVHVVWLLGLGPTGWLRIAATTRCGARSMSFIANGPPMQLPKKKNLSMPRW